MRVCLCLQFLIERYGVDSPGFVDADSFALDSVLVGFAAGASGPNLEVASPEFFITICFANCAGADQYFLKEGVIGTAEERLSYDG